MVSVARWVRSLVPFLILGLISCGRTGSPLAPDSDEPFLYLVLNQTVDMTAEPRQTAFLLRTGTPTRSEYLSATRFEMRNSKDGALFGWKDLEFTGRAPVSVTSADLASANYELPDSPVGGLLGRSRIQPGRRYRLEVEVANRIIRGETTVPDTFPYFVDDERRRVMWSTVRGARGYSVEFTHGGTEITADTTVPIPPDVTSGFVLVTALDANVYGYLVDDERGRSGINDGFGVFGAVTPGTPTRLPPDTN